MIDSMRPHIDRLRTRVFLSGRIDRVDLKDAAQWRQVASELLWQEGFDVYDPTRVMLQTSWTGPIPKEVFTNDRWNLMRSDVLLVNLNLPETIDRRDIPFFTIGEMFIAHEIGLPLITFGGCYEGRPGYDAIVTRSFETMDAALHYVISAYGPARGRP
jgi:hypothetical protein